MTRHLMLAFSLALVTSFPPGPATAVAAEPADAAEKPAGTLRLLPDAKPADAPTLDALAATRWVCGGIKNILGAGSDEFLAFRVDKDKGLQVEATHRRWRSVNDRAAAAGGKRYADQSSTSAATAVGPVLRYDGHQETFVVVPGKTLVLSAVVPLGGGGGGRWYYASRQTWGQGGAGPFRDDEMLFDFADDPLKVDAGKATLEMRGGENPSAKEAVTFKLVGDRRGAAGGGRMIDVIGANARQLARIQFAPDGAYGALLDRPNRNSRVFLPAQAGD